MNEHHKLELLKDTNMKEDIEQVEKLLERHIKWLNNLPIPTQGVCIK